MYLVISPIVSIWRVVVGGGGNFLMKTPVIIQLTSSNGTSVISSNFNFNKADGSGRGDYLFYKHQS